MVGFTADYASGEIHIQKEELAQAGWFTRENMPEIPDSASIARRLIDDWLNKLG
jgi:NAD+ diphosphatase